jgi:hypothetical protein
MIIKPVKLLIATIGLSLGSAAIAEDLVYYNRGANGTVAFYDRETIRRNGNQVTVWTFMDESKNKSVSYRSVRIKWIFNCINETSGLISIAYYNSNGSVVDSAFSEYPEMTPVIPQSFGASLFEAVCAT